MMKTIFSIVTAAMLMSGCMAGDEAAPSTEAVEVETDNVSAFALDSEDVEAKARQARYCTARRPVCCEREDQVGIDDGDQFPNECWFCMLPGQECP